jgi:hypothetical protein
MAQDPSDRRFDREMKYWQVIRSVRRTQGHVQAFQCL